jgi:hypothetical protein
LRIDSDEVGHRGFFGSIFTGLLTVMSMFLAACLLKVTATGLHGLPLLIALLYGVRLSRRLSPVWHFLRHYRPSFLNVRFDLWLPAQRPIDLRDDDNRDFFAHDHLSQLDRILRDLGFNVIHVHDFKVAPSGTTGGEIDELSVGKHSSSELIIRVYLIITKSILREKKWARKPFFY